MFLNSLESPLSLESSHMPVNRIWCPYILGKISQAEGPVQPQVEAAVVEVEVVP